MKLVKKGQGQMYDAKQHFGCWAMRLLAADKDTQKLSASISHFLPGGGAEMTSSPLERIYYVLAGSLKAIGKTKEYLMEPGDTFYIPPNEEREIRVQGTEPATILVVVAK